MSTITVCLVKNAAPYNYIGVELQNDNGKLQIIEELRKKATLSLKEIDTIIRIASETLDSFGTLIKIYKKNNWQISDNQKLETSKLLVKLENIQDSYPSKIVRYFLYYFDCSGEYERMCYESKLSCPNSYQTFQ